MDSQLSYRLLWRDVAEQESLEGRHQGKIGCRHHEVDRQRHGDEEERGTGVAVWPSNKLAIEGTVAPTVSTAYCTKSMPMATAIVVTYPTTRYPAVREDKVKNFDEIRGAPDGSAADEGTEELMADRGRMLVPSGMSAPPSSELFGPMKQ